MTGCNELDDEYDDDEPSGIFFTYGSFNDTPSGLAV